MKRGGERKPTWRASVQIHWVVLKKNIRSFSFPTTLYLSVRQPFDLIKCKTTFIFVFINVEKLFFKGQWCKKRSFSKTIVIRFLHVQNQWVAFNNDRFLQKCYNSFWKRSKRNKKQSINDHFQKRWTTLTESKRILRCHLLYLTIYLILVIY